MRVAIPSDDQQTLGRHAGRCAGFVVVELAAGAETAREYRANTFTHHALGEHDHDHGPGHHTGIVQALGDCDLLVAGGMGRRLHEDLDAAGIRACLTDLDTVDAVVTAVLADALVDLPERCCQHEHGHGPEQLHQL